MNKKCEKYITSDKIFHHLHILNNWKNGKEVYPITVEIHPSNFCNNRCYYCKYKKEKKFLDRNDFEIILKKLKKIKVKGITLSGGGEPTLNMETKNFLRLIKRNGIDAALITNLSLYDNNLFQNIVKFTEWCRISLDSATRQTYKNIRGVDMFNNVVNNTRELVRLKKNIHSNITIGIQAVVCKKNLNEVFGIIKLASNLKVDYIQVRPVEILPLGSMPYSASEYFRVLSYIEKARSLESDSFKIIFSDKWDIVNPNLKHKEHGFTFCHGYPFIGAIDVNGDYYICCHKIELKDKRFCCGNVIREPINRIMSRRKKVIEKLDLKECYLGCRGSNLNRRLEGLRHQQEHRNFL